MRIIPPINPLFLLVELLAFLLFIWAAVVINGDLQARWRTRIFFGCSCCILLASTFYPYFLYHNKSAPLTSPEVLIGENMSGQVVALNARDGSVRWTQPATINQVYVVRGPGNLFYTVSQSDDRTSMTIAARTANNDSPVWYNSLPLPEDSDGPIQRVIVDSGFIYIDKALNYSEGEDIYALHINNGSLAWKYSNLISVDTSNPLLIAAGNGLVFARKQDYSFSALHADDGSLAWHFPRSDGSLAWHFPQEASYPAAQLVLAGQTVYYLQPTNSQYVSLFALTQEDGKPLWQTQIVISFDCSIQPCQLATDGEYLYVSTYKQMTLLNAWDGAQIWQRTSIWGTSNSGIMTEEADGILYAPGPGTLTAIDTHNWNVLWSLPADPDDAFTNASLTQNVLFATAQVTLTRGYGGDSGKDAVVAINPADGSVYWSTTAMSYFVGIYTLP